MMIPVQKDQGLLAKDDKESIEQFRNLSSASLDGHCDTNDFLETFRYRVRIVNAQHSSYLGKHKQRTPKTSSAMAVVRQRVFTNGIVNPLLDDRVQQMRNGS